MLDHVRYRGKTHSGKKRKDVNECVEPRLLLHEFPGLLHVRIEALVVGRCTKEVKPPNSTRSTI